MILQPNICEGKECGSLIWPINSEELYAIYFEYKIYHNYAPTPEYLDHPEAIRSYANIWMTVYYNGTHYHFRPHIRQFITIEEFEVLLQEYVEENME